MGALERGVPLALAIFCGVAGGLFTFQPYFVQQQQERLSKAAETTQRQTNQASSHQESPTSTPNKPQ
ncbi:hypothetical protein V2G26_015070 [Clonostachys chloroleuca]